jgi:hypothetical protein
MARSPKQKFAFTARPAAGRERDDEQPIRDFSWPAR